MTSKQELILQLEPYGLGENESKIYMFLLAQPGELSVVQIAKELRLGRTPVYNALDKLENKGLTAKIMAENGYNYTANSPDNLEEYWRRRERKVQRLGAKLPDVVSALDGLATGSGHRSKTKYYTGRDGLEQITYNSLRAKNDLYIYEVATNMTNFVNKNTAEKFRQILVEREITTHQLTNYTQIEAFTEVERMITDFWDIRHIDPKILKIQFEMLIYNDVCALYSVSGRDIFGVEIHNANLAAMQKQIFSAIQRLAKPMKKIGLNGEAKV
ncbi:MAG: HTH domain-containing protein [Candidatus Nomurabacteria bacterium]|jgi:sugar-specific transcriptional regulator TrmB|nr:HTH domain-containing protein [Candidatus Nomurabacteria bacterium]